jgi:hypothetical protein
MDPIKTGDVMEGDVLLYNGKGLVSKLIRFFDGTEVNHAAIYLGAGKVGEAQAGGLNTSKLEDGIKSNNYLVIRRLTVPPESMQPVIIKAQYYLDIKNRYAFDQLFLLAILGLSRKLKVNGYLKWLLRKLLDQAADFLTENGDKQPMICSEFVYRCYNEANPVEHDPFTLNIDPLPAAVSGRIRGVRALSGETLNDRIHRDSLLAWAGEITQGRTRAVSGTLLRSIREGAVSRTLSAEDKKMSAMPLDDLITSYLDEVRKPSTRSLTAEASLRSPEMLSSIEKFAGALNAVTDKPAAEVGHRRSAGKVEDQVAANFSNLFTTVADFVTPGDLYKCIDLSNVGQISAGT